MSDDLRRRILSAAAEWASRYACLKHVYVFGSFARGDHTPTSDIDIAVEFVGDFDAIADDDVLLRSYGALQDGYVEWATALGTETGHRVEIHRIMIADAEDAAWPAIQAARDKCLISIGKALLVPTPRKP